MVYRVAKLLTPSDYEQIIMTNSLIEAVRYMNLNVTVNQGYVIQYSYDFKEWNDL